MSIEVYSKPVTIRAHNRLELTAEIFTDWAKNNDIELRFIQLGKPSQNALVEWFNKKTL
jgi:putative transposase